MSEFFIEGAPSVDAATPKPLKKVTPEDRAKELADSIGDLSKIKDIYPSKVLCGVYIRETVGNGLLYSASDTQREDLYQGKAFLVLKLGTAAFQNDGHVNFFGFDPKVNDWVAARPADGEHIKVNGIDCRLFDDRDIRMIIADPECVY